MESDLAIRDVMAREYVGVSESDSVEGAVQLMRDERVGSVVILRGSDPVGIMTEWDILEMVANGDDPSETTVSEQMSSPVLTMEADRRLSDATETMSRQNIRRMLVTDGGEIVGILSERDVIAASSSLSRMAVRNNAQAVGTADTSGEGPTVVEFGEQSICEGCGSLARNLSNQNGQLLCTNCREM